MSRGFVKENDQEEVPMVPPRADLPTGLTNYVTETGMKLLLEEREELLLSISKLPSLNENENRIATNFINAKLQLLNERISTAKVVELATQPTNKVRFGASVTLEVNDQKNALNYQIVGVDEANIKQNKIAFNSPIAHLLIDKKVGDEAVLELGTRKRIFKILAID